jgi:RNA polymerase primary sigma factor
MNEIQNSYEEWYKSPTPASMARVLKSVEYIINTEVHRYPGPNALLRGRAKKLAIDAVRSYDPASGARLTSWITTQMQQLSRYGNTLQRPIRTPEVAARQAAEINARRQELRDELGDDPTDEQMADVTGISVRRIQSLKKMVRPSVGEASMESDGEGGDAASYPAVDEEGDPRFREATEMTYAGLDDRDKTIFDLKTGRNGLSSVDNKSIAKRLGVSEGLISQRSLDITNRIRETMDYV